MIKPKLWNECALEGTWIVSYKIDGVRALYKDGAWVSRAGKPLYNMPKPLDETEQDVEVFMGDWETTISAVRSHSGHEVPAERLFSLEPLDERLYRTTLVNPGVENILWLLERAVKNGHEGLILRQGDTWLKVKTQETYDVEVIGIKPGKNKNEGKLGSLLTPMGAVGTGLSDQEREELLTIPLGTIIEVECMELTKNGKFRHPRFIRVRWDK